MLVEVKLVTISDMTFEPTDYMFFELPLHTFRPHEFELLDCPLFNDRLRLLSFGVVYTYSHPLVLPLRPSTMHESLFFPLQSLTNIYIGTCLRLLGRTTVA